MGTTTSDLSSVSVSSDRAVRCSERAGAAANTFTTTLEVFPDSPSPFTVQCAAVRVCDLPGTSDAADEAAMCGPTACYGTLTHVEGMNYTKFSVSMNQTVKI